jgi:hypothetical protein
MATKAPPSGRSNFFTELPSPARPVARSLSDLFAHQESNLDWYHRAGIKLRELDEAMDGAAAGWFGRLAQGLNISRSNLTKIRKFAADFTVGAVRKMDEQGIGWSMILAVQNLEKAKQVSLLNEAVAKKWNGTELKAMVRKRFGADHAGGRPIAAPRSPREMLSALHKLNQRWLRFHDEVWSAEDGGVESLHSLSASQRKQVAQLLPQVYATIQQMQTNVATVAAALGQVKRAVRS